MLRVSYYGRSPVAAQVSVLSRNESFRESKTRNPTPTTHYQMPSLPSLLQSNPEAEADSLGGWNLAVLVDIFLQGILTAQFARYTNINKRDSRLILALLTTAKSTQYIAVVWLLNVKHMGIDLWYSSWASHATLITEAAIALYVQIFLCYRLWTPSITDTSWCLPWFCCSLRWLQRVLRDTPEPFCPAAQRQAYSIPSSE
ncbi:hypothetical protein DFH06DRAFT_1305597 [Mycena polygramma]|nr:hypothetical protein DFH06DRAFT_1305597 [Mycena polygramma]